jgi:hypothetical protein
MLALKLTEALPPPLYITTISQQQQPATCVCREREVAAKKISILATVCRTVGAGLTVRRHRTGKSYCLRRQPLRANR